ncbi:MAG: NTP transferase domain-containing protein [Ruminococcus sp.]|nr:NTP transferase domain-containing protein [Ruminococcus sp.]
MKTAVITAAGISSRFNEGIPESEKQLKGIYGGGDRTLLYHLVRKCLFADKIIVVGGYKFDDLKEYLLGLKPEIRDKIALVYNENYKTLSSGYSLYLGLAEAFKCQSDEILFIEGDLDVDRDSLDNVIKSRNSVLTYNYEPIYANKAVVLYKDSNERFRYAFNSSHGMLEIKEPFSCILNSGQIWKFTDIEKLKAANDSFFSEEKNGTNLRIIQNYIDHGTEADLIGLKRWTNCNTREDYDKIVSYWEEELK